MEPVFAAEKLFCTGKNKNPENRAFFGRKEHGFGPNGIDSPKDLWYSEIVAHLRVH